MPMLTSPAEGGAATSGIKHYLRAGVPLPAAAAGLVSDGEALEHSFERLTAASLPAGGHTPTQCDRSVGSNLSRSAVGATEEPVDSRSVPTKEPVLGDENFVLSDGGSTFNGDGLVASAHHAAVNFGQYDFGGYFPNRPSIARTNMPVEEPVDATALAAFLDNPDQALRECFPSQVQATLVMAVLDLLSTHSPDEEYLGGMETAEEVRAEVRDVWAGNFDNELSNLMAVLPHYPRVCVDTEFPGVVHDSDTPRYLRGPRVSYALLKKNVDDLKLLQVGIALSGPADRFPVVWQFNLRGFDPARHPYTPASVALLRAQGMHFATMKEFGIAPDDFAVGFHRSGLACGQHTWTAFSGSYDFAYLAKELTGGQPLPGTLDRFLALVRQLFGPNVFDVNHLARCCAMRGGLEQVAAALGVERAAGRAHCAGSDSLLTTDVFLATLNRYFMNVDVLTHAGTIVDLA